MPSRTSPLEIELGPPVSKEDAAGRARGGVQQEARRRWAAGRAGRRQGEPVGERCKRDSRQGRVTVPVFVGSL